MIVIGHKNPDTDTIVSAIVWAQVQKKLGHKKVVAGRAGQLNNETKFVLKHFKVAAPRLIKDIAKKEVFLVDHNSPGESAKGREKAVLKGVLDHHYLSGIETSEPIFFRCEPVGSTSTLVAKFAQENGFQLNKLQAGLLLAGLLSDTLKFTSPTTTKEDKKIAKNLQAISSLKINDFARKMFEAKSSLAQIKIQEIVGKDYKEFQFGRTKLGFGVWETAVVRPLLDKKVVLEKALAALKKKQRLDLVFFAVVDIFKRQSYWLVVSEAERALIQKVFGHQQEKEGLIFMQGVVSRKKQMIPPLSEYLKRK